MNGNSVSLRKGLRVWRIIALGIKRDQYTIAVQQLRMQLTC